jgi:hypothetical protein
MSSATIFFQLADSVLRTFVVAALNEIAPPANVTAVGKQRQEFAGKPIVVGPPGLTRQRYWKASPDVIRLSEN